MNFENNTPKSDSIIKVIGVGGGGSNAVNHMYSQGIKDVSFVVCNTDSQALANSPVPNKIQLGASLTEGRGAGNKPERGRESAIENIVDIENVLSDGTKMVFVTAGMGGGTGTGAAPVIAEVASKLDILTVGIVTIPFLFEGNDRISQALDGIYEMENYVDSLLVINNEKLITLYGDFSMSEAFAKADDVLSIAAKGIAEIITVHGRVNVDFADVETVMKGSGVAVMGSASAEGENRGIDAVCSALESPLLNSSNIRGAKNILINITTGDEELSMSQMSKVTRYVQEQVGGGGTIIYGTCTDESLGDSVNITIIATGFGTKSLEEFSKRSEMQVVKHELLGAENQVTKNDIDKPLEFELEFDSANASIEKEEESESISLEDRKKLYYKEEVIEDESDDNTIKFKRSKDSTGIADRFDSEDFDLNDPSFLEHVECVPAYIRKVSVQPTDV